MHSVVSNCGPHQITTSPTPSQRSWMPVHGLSTVLQNSRDFINLHTGANPSHGADGSVWTLTWLVELPGRLSSPFQPGGVEVAPFVLGFISAAAAATTGASGRRCRWRRRRLNGEAGRHFRLSLVEAEEPRHFKENEWNSYEWTVPPLVLPPLHICHFLHTCVSPQSSNLRKSVTERRFRWITETLIGWISVCRFFIGWNVFDVTHSPAQNWYGGRSGPERLQDSSKERSFPLVASGYFSKRSHIKYN